MNDFLLAAVITLCTVAGVLAYYKCLTRWTKFTIIATIILFIYVVSYTFVHELRHAGSPGWLFQQPQ